MRGLLDQSGYGTTHEPISFVAVLWIVFGTPEYSLGEKFRYLRASRASMEALWPDFMQTDLADNSRFEIPVILLQGRHDRLTPFALAREFYELIEAPEKHFYSFEASAHSVPFEEPEAFNAIVRKHAGLE